VSFAGADVAAAAKRLRSGRFAGLLLALMLGCAGAGPAPPARVVLADAASDAAEPVLLILPLNVAVVMPPEVGARSHLVQDAIEAYLEQRPFRLKTVAFESARRLWVDSIRRARAGEKGQRAGYEDAARLFVQELARHAEFDYVVAPSLYLREAPVSRGVADWDGVRRTLEVEAVGAENRRRILDTPFEGVAPGASLHAVVFDGRGEKLQEGLGGLDLIAKVYIPRERDPETGGPVVEFVPREDFFAVPERLREGIAIALAPFLPSDAAGD
jgi:hypothetical protein